MKKYMLNVIYAKEAKEEPLTIYTKTLVETKIK